MEKRHCTAPGMHYNTRNCWLSYPINEYLPSEQVDVKTVSIVLRGRFSIKYTRMICQINMQICTLIRLDKYVMSTTPPLPPPPWSVEAIRTGRCNLEDLMCATLARKNRLSLFQIFECWFYTQLEYFNCGIRSVEMRGGEGHLLSEVRWV